MPKFFVMLSITVAICLASYLMFGTADDMIPLLQPYKANGNYYRQIILISCVLVYILRLIITTFVFLKRKLFWTEATVIAILMSIALFSFLHIGGSSPLEINVLDYSGIILFLIGSWINTQSEYTRQRPSNL